MREFKKGKLRSSAGPKVTKRKQAIAIALSEAGLSRKKKKNPGTLRNKYGKQISTRSVTRRRT